jgi:hypothetical protein
VAHYCDASISYGMMVKAGNGIGLLSNYTMMDPAFRPLDLDVHVKLRLHAVALTERLEAKPVRIVMGLLEELFSAQNPWFLEADGADGAGSFLPGAIRDAVQPLASSLDMVDTISEKSI